MHPKDAFGFSLTEINSISNWLKKTLVDADRPRLDRDGRVVLRRLHGSAAILRRSLFTVDYFRTKKENLSGGILEASTASPTNASWFRSDSVVYAIASLSISARCMTRMGFFFRRIRPSMCMRQDMSLAVRISVPADS